MQTDELISKLTVIITRGDGSQARIVATAMYGIGLHRSVDVYVHRRASCEHQWQLCSKSPHPNFKSMSREEYIHHGRSEMFQTVSHGEIFKVVGLIGKPTALLAQCYP
jgi:hypothetical protein